MIKHKLSQIENLPQRVLLFGFGMTVLILVFLFQRINYTEELANLMSFDINNLGSQGIFSINKTIRFIINDVMTIVIIYAIFYERKYVIFAVYVQLFGLLVLLPAYLIAKWYYPTYNGPLINYLHRLTLNPVLLMLLIPSFILQKRSLLK